MHDFDTSKNRTLISCRICNDLGRVSLYDSKAPAGTAAYSFKCTCVMGVKFGQMRSYDKAGARFMRASEYAKFKELKKKNLD